MYISVRALFPLQIHSYDGNLTLKITFDSEEPPSEPAEAIIVGNGITLIWKKPSMLQPINEQVWVNHVSCENYYITVIVSLLDNAPNYLVGCVIQKRS